MPGNIANASMWQHGAVYIADELTTADPATITATFGTGWTPVGLLSTDGFEWERDQDTENKPAWGVGTVRKKRGAFTQTIKFGVLEDNATTRKLAWPGSTDTALVVPQPVPVKMAFEVIEGKTVLRRITKAYAEVDVDGSWSENEEDLTNVPLVATIYPDTSTTPPTLFTVQKGTLA